MLKERHRYGLEQKRLVAKVKIDKQHMKQKHQRCQVAQSLVGWAVGYIFSLWRSLDFLLLSTWFFFCDWFFCVDNQGLFFNFLCTCSSFYSRHPPNLLSRWLAVSCSWGLGLGSGRRNVRSRLDIVKKQTRNKQMRNMSENRSELGGENRSETNANEVRKRSEIFGKIVGCPHGTKACPFIVPAGKCRVGSRKMSWQWKRNVITSQWFVSPKGLQALVVFLAGAQNSDRPKKTMVNFMEYLGLRSRFFFLLMHFFLDWKFAFKTRCPPRKKLKLHLLQKKNQWSQWNFQIWHKFIKLFKYQYLVLTQKIIWTIGMQLKKPGQKRMPPIVPCIFQNFELVKFFHYPSI